MAFGVQVEFWGDLALFTRPETKVERYSYDCVTPSAARGMLESIYYHPGLVYKITKIHVLNPIRFTSVRRNEVKSKISASNVMTAMKSRKEPLFLDASQDIVQRAAVMLRDVRYVIEAHFEMTPRANPTDSPEKFYAILMRRLKKGQCYSQPYLGTRECTAHFRLFEGELSPSQDLELTRDLGLMLYDMDYSDPNDITPMFFRANLRGGTLDLTDCEVFR